MTKFLLFLRYVQCTPLGGGYCSLLLFCIYFTFPFIYILLHFLIKFSSSLSSSTFISRLPHTTLVTLTLNTKMAEKLIADLAAQLQALAAQTPSQVSTVSIKLPEFWTKSPEVWFAKVEAQFGTRGISLDQTKYDYVVSALDINTAEEVQSILTNPPTTNKYGSLKAALVKTFGKSQVQKDIELLNLQGLGDKRPSALLRRINALNDDPQTLKRALFLVNLPADIRSILAGHDVTDIEALAATADRIWESRNSGVPQVSAMLTDTPIVATEASNQPAAAVEAVSTTGRRSSQRRARSSPQRDRFSFSSTAATTPSSVCFYHLRFGLDARRCQPGCKFASLLFKAGKHDTSSAGNAAAGR